MSLYEHVFLARQDISAQQVEGLVQGFRTILEGAGGTIGKTEYWGLKSLTYPHQEEPQGALHADEYRRAASAAVAELERQMRLSTDVIRFLTIRVDEHDAGPSAMMRRADRDEREGAVATVTAATAIVAIAASAAAAAAGSANIATATGDFTPREARAAG